MKEKEIKTIGIGINIYAEQHNNGARFTVEIDSDDERVCIGKEDAEAIVKAINKTMADRFEKEFNPRAILSDERKATSEADIDERQMMDDSPKQKNDSSEGEKFSSKPDGLSEKEDAAVEELFDDIETALSSILTLAGDNSKADKNKAANEFIKLLAKVGELTMKEFPLFCEVNDFPTVAEAGAAFDALLETSAHCRCEPGIYPQHSTGQSEDKSMNFCGGCKKEVK